MMTQKTQKNHKALALRMLALFALSFALLAIVILAPTLAQEEPSAPGGQQMPAVPADDPDFSMIDDPLNFEYDLFPADDLLIMRSNPVDNNTSMQVNNYILETEFGRVITQSVRNVLTPTCWLTEGRQPQQTRVGRFFNLGYDVIMTLAPVAGASGGNCTVSGDGNNMSLHIQELKSGVNHATQFKMSAASTALAMDDFNKDGFDDLFIMSDKELIAATAKNLANVNQGMVFGKATTLPSVNLATDFDPTTGDFNSDGLVDVAWIGDDRTVHFATVCPGPVPGTICSDAEKLEILLDPLQSQAVPITLPSGQSGCTNRSALVSGQFDPQSFDGDGLIQFVCTYAGNRVNPLTAVWYQFDGDWSMVGGGPISEQELTGMTNTMSGAPRAVFARAGKLDWFGESEQVAWAVNLIVETGGPGDWVSRVWVGTLTFENKTIINQMVATQVPSDGFIPGGQGPVQPYLNGLAIGRFGTISDPTDEAAYNLEIAVAFNRITSGLTQAGFIRTYGLDSNLKPGGHTNVVLNPDPRHKANLSDPQQTNWLTAGDLQGRSGRLGPPSIIRVSSHSQPSVILGAPPMHVDYILPSPSTGSEWDIVNFTAVPDSYNSIYTMSQTTSNQSSDTNRTSYTYSSTEQGDASFSFKPPYLPSIGGALKKTTEDKVENFKETYQFTQNEFTYDASTTTGFGDEIWYDVSNFNVYHYPVLGQTICPADNGSCAPGEEEQLYLTLSGPASNGTGPGPGATTEWYQPLHEPGNIFSYPWDENQLKLQVSEGIDLLTRPQHFYTDDSDQAQMLRWDTKSEDDQTTGSTNSHSFEKSYSLTGGNVIGKILNVNLKGDYSYNDSTSTSTLNKSSSSVGASQGIAIAKPGTFLDTPLYLYRVEPYIFGRTPSVGTVDTLTLTQDIQTMGPLQAGFAANPLDPEAGSWWVSDASPYQQYIDVALNHPVRWTKTAPNNNQDSLNCLEASVGLTNCMIFNDPISSDIWNSEFHWMRGLFITLFGADGPQRTQATAGDDVMLQARVYNYSFKDMPSDAKIQVRFYRQPIQGTTPLGNSVIIDQVAVDPLPGFNSPNSPDTPNWATATAMLDTTGLGNTYQIFWVLVWVEDGAGNMIKELPGHGLSEKPGSLTSIANAPLAKVTFDGAPKTFSNNVGFLHRKFYIASNGSPAPQDDDPNLSIENAQVTPSSASAGDRVIVSADILAEDASAEAIHVQLYPDAYAYQAYQDDPTLPPPRAFDVEMLPYIGEGESDRIEVPYRPQGCGTQTILITAEVGIGEIGATAEIMLDMGPCRVYSPLVPVQPQR